MAIGLMRSAFQNSDRHPMDYSDDDLSRLGHICFNGAEALLIALYARDKQEPDNDHVPPSH